MTVIKPPNEKVNELLEALEIDTNDVIKVTLIIKVGEIVKVEIVKHVHEENIEKVTHVACKHRLHIGKRIMKLVKRGMKIMRYNLYAGKND